MTRFVTLSKTNRNVPRLAQPDRSRRCGRQIDLPAAYKWPSVVDPHDDASAVTDLNEGSERQRAMRGRHCPAIQPLAVCGARAAETVAAAIDAGHLGMY